MSMKLIEAKEDDKWYNQSTSKQALQRLLLIVSSAEQSLRYNLFAESHLHYSSHLTLVD